MPTVLAFVVGGGSLDIFALVCYFSFLSLSLRGGGGGGAAPYRLKCYLKVLGLLNPNNHPTA